MHGMSLSDENLILDCPVVSDAAPVVVGGIGGSGTRVFAQLLRDLGFDMGSDLNESLDDLGFTALFKRNWHRQYVGQYRCFNSRIYA